MHCILQEQGRRNTAAEWIKILALLGRAKSIVPILYSINSTLISNTSRQEWYPAGTSITAHLYCILKNDHVWQLLPKPPLDEKPNEDPFFSSLHRHCTWFFYVIFSCNVYSRLKTLSFLLGDICHWTIRAYTLEDLARRQSSDAKMGLWCPGWP